MVTVRYNHRAKKNEQKRRPIAYASHIDSAIYSFYSHELSCLYEMELRSRNLDECVLAYRPRKGACYKSAIAVFRQSERFRLFTAYGFDVKGFFDSLDHGLLKKKWIEILGVPQLPDHHYAVYRAISNYSWVNREDIESFVKGAPVKPGHRYFSPRTFREQFREKGKVHKNPNRFGIPQGAPISAVLSNIYMLDIDVKLKRFAESHGGIYRRYADDLLLIIPGNSDFEVVQKTVEQALTDAKLSIQNDKTEKCTIHVGDRCERPFQYLGLTYDGVDIRIRSSSISRFYRKMKAGVAAKRNVARAKNGKLWTAALWRSYSHVGRRNFYTYVKSVSNAAGSKAPKVQLRNHVKVLRTAIEGRNAHAKRSS